MPYPKKDEDKKSYIARFMASPEANKDFPDEKQRYAVAHSMWEKRNAVDEGWPKSYSCSFIEPGVVFYQDLGEHGETILVDRDALAKMAQSFVGKPVINFVHKDVTPQTVADGDADGIVSKVWLGADGWWYCEFLVWDQVTQRNCESGAYSVSCAYEPTKVSQDGGTCHNVPYQEEVLDGVYTHLAVVANPRYEGARIFVNSKGGSNMWKFWKSGKEKKNAADLDPMKCTVDVDGEKVTLQQLYDAVKPEQSALEMSDDSVFEVDGKEHTLKAMKDAHRAKNAAAKEAEPKKDEKKLNDPAAKEDLRAPLKDGEAKNDEAEDAAKKAEGAAKEKEALERQQADDKKKEDDLKNAADEKKKEDERRNAGKKSFDDLKSVATARSGDPVGIKMVTPEDRLAAGAKKYGSAPKAN